MKRQKQVSDVEITRLILACCGRYNSYRVPRLAMEDITSTDRYVKRGVTHN